MAAGMRMSALAGLALLLAVAPTADAWWGKCWDIEECSACCKDDPTKCCNCKAGYYPVCQYTVQAGDTFVAIAAQFGITPNALLDMNRGLDPAILLINQVISVPCGKRELPTACAACNMEGCADCDWTREKPYKKCTKPCADPHCLSCQAHTAIWCYECEEGYTWNIKERKCVKSFGGQQGCGENNPLGYLWYARSEFPYNKWQFRDLPAGCWPCEDPVIHNCKFCGFCTPGEPNCLASKNYDGNGVFKGYSKIDGAWCNECKDGYRPANHKC